jgi:hemerythrin
MLIQGIGMIEAAIRGEENLGVAFNLLHQIVSSHMRTENEYLWLLPKPEAEVHYRVHTHILDLVEDYTIDLDDPGFTRLQAICEVLRAHSGSHEEERMTEVVRDAVASGRVQAGRAG